MRFSLFLDKSHLHNSAARRSARRVLAYSVRMAQKRPDELHSFTMNEKIIVEIVATHFIKNLNTLCSYVHIRCVCVCVCVRIELWYLKIFQTVMN